MCKSDGYEPYMTLDTPAADSDPDVVLWEPSTVANESVEALWKPSAYEEPGMSSSGLWEPPPVASATNELLWESSTLNSSANAVLWGAVHEPPSDPIVSNEWLWKPPPAADASSEGMWEPSTVGTANGDGAWKPSYVVNDSSDGTWKPTAAVEECEDWKHTAAVEECEDWKPTYVVNESTEGLWKPSTLSTMPTESTGAFWDGSFTASSVQLESTSYDAVNGNSEWTPASGSSTMDEGLWNESGGEVVKCADCPQEFPSKGLLHRHRLHFHKHFDRLCCTQCDEVFSVHEDLELHFNNRHASKKTTLDPSKKFSCKECPSSFTTPFSLRRHFDQFHDDSKPKKVSVADQHCTKCPRSFTTAFSLHRHHQSMHGIQRPKQSNCNAYSCPECFKSFSKAYSLKRHYLTHSKGLYGAAQVTERPLSDSPDVPFTCSLCCMDFTRADKFNTHMQMHSGAISFKCSQCPMTYTSTAELNRHTTRVHDQRHFCTLCPRKFGFMNELARHMTSHSTIKGPLLFCSLCERTFANYSYLNKHYRRVHGVTDPYSCVGCGDAFTTMAKLEHHLRTVCVFDIRPDDSAGGPSFGCQTCGMRFVDTRNLGNHLLEHVKPEEKPDANPDLPRALHHCPKCGLGYKKKQVMLSHLATHSAVLFCTDCDETFSGEPSLVRHCRTQHDDVDERREEGTGETFLCTVCLHTFDQHCDLLKHLNQHLGR